MLRFNKTITQILEAITPEEAREKLKNRGNEDYGVKVLSISKPNAKIDHYSISLPAGHTCCGAKICKTMADRVTGVMKDGDEAELRCFAASQERQPNVRNSRWGNLDLIKSMKNAHNMADLIETSIRVSPAFFHPVFRIHIGGDFFSKEYFKAWIMVANRLDHILFYAYTKELRHWVALLDKIPENLILTASEGGHFDELIDEYNLRHSKIVYSEEEAEELGLKIDVNDDLAWNPDVHNFALLLHGTQPKGTEAAKAVSKLRSSGKGGYKPRKDNY